MILETFFLAEEKRVIRMKNFHENIYWDRAAHFLLLSARRRPIRRRWIVVYTGM
jgi:hypothetical protein